MSLSVVCLRPQPSLTLYCPGMLSSSLPVDTVPAPRRIDLNRSLGSNVMAFDRKYVIASVSAALESDTGRWVSRHLSPIAAAASAPLESVLFLASYRPSLMPRATVHQGVAAGVHVLFARSASGIVEYINRQVVPSNASLPGRLAVRSVAYALGEVLERLPARGDAMNTSQVTDAFTAAGTVVKFASVSGALFDAATASDRRLGSRGGTGAFAIAGITTAGVAYVTSKRLDQRKHVIERWPVPQYSTLGGPMGVSFGISTIGTVAARAYLITRDALVHYLGPGWSKGLLARLVNAGLWAFGSSALFNGFIGYVGRANERLEPGYSVPPTSSLLSGGPESVSPFDELGLQGRRFVSHALTEQQIQNVMGEPAISEPIRVYVGFNSQPVYQTGRAELALEELARTGAFDRSYLLLVSPTGTGWVDHAVVEAAELMTKGDIATCCIQYGRYPSPLCIQKLALGRSQFRLLLWGVRQRLLERQAEDRPKVLVFGESLGAWASSDVLMHQGIAGFDHYGIDRALWFGLPGMAKWSRNGMARGSNSLVPPGTVGVFDRPEQLDDLTDSERDRLRAILLSHDNDPIALADPRIAIQRPPWLQGERGRGVPKDMDWTPVSTFLQVAVDAANSMVTVPGDFRSFGHDYRADTARFVRDGFQLPEPTGEQLANIERALREIESARAAQVALEWEDAGVAKRARQERQQVLSGVPLLPERATGARWIRSLRRKPPEVSIPLEEPAGVA